MSMKNTFTLFLFLLLHFPLFSQERVSNIKAESTPNLRYLATHEGRIYVVEITPDDDVNVYEAQSKENIKYLWSRNINQAYKQNNHFILDNRLVFSPGFGITSYDFVKNSGPDAYYYSAFTLFGSWISYGPKSALFFDSKSEPFIYNLETKNVTEIYRYYSPHASQYPFVYSSGIAPNGLRHYYFQNTASDISELLVESTALEHIGNFDDLNHFWYLDKDMALVQIDLAKTDRKEFGLYSAFPKKKNIVLPAADVVTVIQSAPDTTYIELFDTNNKTKVKEFKIPIDGGVLYDRVARIEQRIFIRSIKNKVFVVDLSGQQEIRSYDIYGNYSGKNIPVINNQMVVPVKNGFLWADLNTGATKESKMPFVMSPLRDLRLVSANNDLIFSATFTNTDLPTLFSVSNGVAEEMPFATNETGCISDARLYPLKNQLVLRDNHLYRVDEKETQLGPHKIIQFTEDVINVNDGKLYFLQKINNRQHIFYTDGEKIDTFCKLPTITSIVKLVKKINNRFFIAMDDDIREYNPDTDQFNFIQQGITGFKEVGNSLFFTANNLLYELNEGAVIVPYYLEMSEAAGYNIFSYRGNVLAISNGEVYSLKDGKFNFVSPYNLSSINYSRIGRYLLYHGFSEVDYRYHFFIVNDLLQVDEIYFEGLIGDVFNDASNEQFGLLKVNNSHTRIFDVDRNKVIELPPDKTVLRWKYIFDGGQDTIAIFREGNQLVSYKLKKLYTQYEKVASLPYNGDDYGMSFQQFDESVLVTRAGYVKLIKNNGEFLELGVSSNQLTFTEAIVHNNYLYFMANSPGTGRQVYRLLPQNITHTDDTHWVVDIVQLYPNPSQHTLHFSFAVEKPISSCQIFDQHGYNFPCAVNNNSILIDHLMPGLHFLHLNSDQSSIRPLKFVKF